MLRPFCFHNVPYFFAPKSEAENGTNLEYRVAVVGDRNIVSVANGVGNSVVGLGYAEGVAYLNGGFAHAPLQTHQNSEVVGVERLAIEPIFATHKAIIRHRGGSVCVFAQKKGTHLSASHKLQDVFLVHSHSVGQRKGNVEVVVVVGDFNSIAVFVAHHTLLRECNVQPHAPMVTEVEVARKTRIEASEWSGVLNACQPRKRYAISYAKRNSLSHGGIANR